jgi:hypothetical protein
MKKDTEIVKQQSKELTMHEPNSGLIIAESFQAESGFEHIAGLRKFGDLTIVEGVAKGTSVMFLSRVCVLDSKKQIIIDKNLARGTHYSRETVLSIVQKELIKMLCEAAKTNKSKFDEEQATILINEKLKVAYFQSSYNAIIAWANEIGINIA